MRLRSGLLTSCVIAFWTFADAIKPTSGDGATDSTFQLRAASFPLKATVSVGPGQFESRELELDGKNHNPHNSEERSGWYEMLMELMNQMKRNLATSIKVEGGGQSTTDHNQQLEQWDKLVDLYKRYGRSRGEGAVDDELESVREGEKLAEFFSYLLDDLNGPRKRRVFNLKTALTKKRSEINRPKGMFFQWLKSGERPAKVYRSLPIGTRLPSNVANKARRPIYRKELIQWLDYVDVFNTEFESFGDDAVVELLAESSEYEELLAAFHRLRDVPGRKDRADGLIKALDDYSIHLWLKIGLSLEDVFSKLHIGEEKRITDGFKEWQKRPALYDKLKLWLDYAEWYNGGHPVKMSDAIKLLVRSRGEEEMVFFFHSLRRANGMAQRADFYQGVIVVRYRKNEIMKLLIPLWLKTNTSPEAVRGIMFKILTDKDPNYSAMAKGFDAEETFAYWLWYAQKFYGMAGSNNIGKEHWHWKVDGVLDLIEKNSDLIEPDAFFRSLKEVPRMSEIVDKLRKAWSVRSLSKPKDDGQVVVASESTPPDGTSLRPRKRLRPAP